MTLRQAIVCHTRYFRVTSRHTRCLCAQLVGSSFMRRGLVMKPSDLTAHISLLNSSIGISRSFQLFATKIFCFLPYCRKFQDRSRYSAATYKAPARVTICCYGFDIEPGCDSVLFTFLPHAVPGSLSFPLSQGSGEGS